MTGDATSGDAVVHFFDAHSRWYRAQTLLERRAIRAAVDAAQPLAGTAVVDLGAGTCLIAREIGRRGIRPSSFVAVDGSRPMLALAGRDRIASRVVTTALHCDVRDVPLPDGSADIVIASFLLHLLDPHARSRTLAEADRLLRSGGRLVVVVHSAPRGWMGWLYRAAWKALSTPCRAPGLPSRLIEDLVPEVRQAGFDVEDARHLPGVYWTQIIRARRPDATH